MAVSVTAEPNAEAHHAGAGPLLEIRELTVRYGGVTAVDAVSFAVPTASIFGLIGPNGAGKTSLVDALTGYTPVSSGHIAFEGAEINRLRAYQRARLGLARTFQSVELFDDLTVEENLMVANERVGAGRAARDLFLPRRRFDRTTVEWALSTCGVADVAPRRPSEISHGQRKLVSVARALAQRPRLVLLDEPAAGLDTDESAELGACLRSLPDEHGVTVLLIDHDMGLVLEVSDLVHVIDFGRSIAEGPPSAIREDRRVIEAYLGGQGDHRVS